MGDALLVWSRTRPIGPPAEGSDGRPVPGHAAWTAWALLPLALGTAWLGVRAARRRPFS